MAKLNKAGMIAAAKAAFGKTFRAETFWDWRNKYKDCSVIKEECPDDTKVRLTYPCKHTVDISKTDPEATKMILANYSYPFCQECRAVSYQAANRERSKKEKAFADLGLVNVGDSFH